jgi:type I restriction enzyme R subunit
VQWPFSVPEGAAASVAQFKIPEILKIPPISERGTVMEIAAMFGGAAEWRLAAYQMQGLLYS